MAATGIGGLGRISSLLNNAKIIFTRSSINHAFVRKFRLQQTCEVVHRIEMPALSPTMDSGTIVKWYKKEGDAVLPGEVLCDVQTDKAVVAMETDDEGILAKILKPDNSQDVKVGTLIALLVDTGDSWQNVEVPEAQEKPATAAQIPTPAPKQIPTPTPAPVAAAVQPHSTNLAEGSADDWHLVGPSVRKLLHEYNLRPNVVPRTGPGGSLLKSDLLNYIAAKGLQQDQPAVSACPGKLAAPPGLEPKSKAPICPATGVAGYSPSTFTDIPISNMRQVIAKRLTESKTTIPHAYAVIDCVMGSVNKLRKQLADNGVKVSVNDFIIKAAGFALQRSPKVNAVWSQDSFQTVGSVDISVAVATEGGLITPIVANVPSLSVQEISLAVKTLAEKARAGKLQPQEFMGGSFSVSNLGMFGITEFSAVINPPQVAILAIGATRLTVGDDSTILPKMSATLSYDSRVLDEQEAAEFLEIFRSALESPNLLMVGSSSVRNLEFSVGRS